MVQFTEDVQGLAPGVSGGRRVPCVALSVAETRQGIGFPRVVADPSVLADGLHIVGDGLGMLAKPVISQSQAVQDGAGKGMLACLPAKLEGLLATAKRLVMIAELDVIPAHRVEGQRLAVPVASTPEQVQGTTGVMQGFAAALLPVEHIGDAEMGPGLPGRIAQAAVQAHGVPQVRVRVLPLPQHGQGVAEGAVHPGLGTRVTQPLHGGQRSALGDGPLVPMTAAAEVRRHGYGQHPGVLVGADACRRGRHGEEYLALGGKPRQCLRARLEIFMTHPWTGPGERGLSGVWLDEPDGRVRAGGRPPGWPLPRRSHRGRDGCSAAGTSVPPPR